MNSRVFGLDFLRATAIVFVLIAHSRFLLGSLLPYSNFLSILGFWGVELFFTLSGFLIGRILIVEHAKSGTLSLNQLKEFWKRRWFRTLPNYYLLLVINIIAVIFLYKTPSLKFSDVSEYFFFLQNLSWPHPEFFGEAWSLAVEEWFYILLPLLAVLADQFTSLNSKSKILLVILLLLLAPTLLRFYALESFDPSWDGGLRKVVAWRLDAIGVGVLIAWVAYWHPDLIKQHRIKFLTVGLALLLISCIHYIVVIVPTKNLTPSWFSGTLYFSVTSFGFAFLLPWAGHWLVKQNNWFITLITFLSKISYSIYIVHFSLVLTFFMDLKTPDQSAATTLLFTVLYLFVTLALSWTLYRFYEKPIMNLRDK